MKRIFVILIALFLILCLSGCLDEVHDVNVNEKERNFKSADDDDIFFWTDPETCVQYVVYKRKVGYAGMGGITPRLNSDGTLYILPCDEDVEQ